jgi:prephenate dehydrogenase
VSARHNIVTIVGAGLLGGSLGLALKERGLATTIRGVGRRQSSLDAAQACGAIDEGFLDLAAACQDADLVVLCTPAAQVPDQLDTVRAACKPSAIVTDVASTKATICTHAAQSWPSPSRFVGSHPMAGSEKWGPEHATASLYNGAITIVEEGDHLDPEAHAAVKSLWESIGSTVVCMAPGDHDALVARSSHIPHIVAACVAELVEVNGNAKAVIGNGFRDVTRVAEGRPELWRDICLTNREAIATGLAALSGRIDAVRAMVEAGASDDLEQFFEAGAEARRKAMDP